MLNGKNNIPIQRQTSFGKAIEKLASAKHPRVKSGIMLLFLYVESKGADTLFFEIKVRNSEGALPLDYSHDHSITILQQNWKIRLH